MSRAHGLALIAVGLVSCGYSKLKVDKIQSVSVTVADARQRFCASMPVALRALVTYRNGEQVQSRAPGESSRGRLRTSEFQALPGNSWVNFGPPAEHRA
jgi:hypothetical protein